MPEHQRSPAVARPITHSEFDTATARLAWCPDDTAEKRPATLTPWYLEQQRRESVKSTGASRNNRHRLTADRSRL